MGLLKDKYVVVTGAASARGLGKATAQMFAEHGATVAILDLDASAAETAADVEGQAVLIAEVEQGVDHARQNADLAVEIDVTVDEGWKSPDRIRSHIAVRPVESRVQRREI